MSILHQCKQPYDPLVLTVSSCFLGHVLFFVLYNVNQYNVVSCRLLLEDFWKKRWGCQLEHFGAENCNKPATRRTHAAIRVIFLSKARDRSANAIRNSLARKTSRGQKNSRDAAFFFNILNL